ncbi:MAG: hypothetical protein D8M59_01800 [Planctomycetes bacterium]|nr:hypothetical protein [Planctomycetota bacterium]
MADEDIRSATVELSKRERQQDALLCASSLTSTGEPVFSKCGETHRNDSLRNGSETLLQAWSGLRVGSGISESRSVLQWNVDGLKTDGRRRKHKGEPRNREYKEPSKPESNRASVRMTRLPEVALPSRDALRA